MSYEKFENEVLVRLIGDDDVKAYLITDALAHNSWGIIFYRARKISAFIPRRSEMTFEVVDVQAEKT